jgi:hypothetical protein
MRRRDFITMLGGATAVWSLAARAQQPKNLPRLCFLTFDPGTLQSNRFEAFFQGCATLTGRTSLSIICPLRATVSGFRRSPRNVCA